MPAKGFQFNLNKCVGCHACIVACNIENKTNTDIQWRSVTSFNSSVFPDIPLFHYSLACNHCKEAPCMHNCPALAYSRDKNTGAVIHHPQKCIGCKYCTWACPYDAPKYNPKTRIVEKCTFCNHRLEKSLKPACANLCPTGALDFVDIPDNIEYQNIPGFTDIGINPSIEIIANQKEKPKLICSEKQILAKPDKQQNFPSKIKLSHEWPLAIFTLLACLMVSAFTASIFGSLKLDSFIFVSLGLIGMLLSMFHLGKKLRAWRSMLNLKRSWLSREIFFFSLFLAISSLYLIYYPKMFFAQPAIIFGLLSLFSIDRVYQIAIQAIKLEIHSAHVLLSFFLFTALFLGNISTFTVIVLIKSGLYIYRKLEMRKMNKNHRLLLSGLRLDMIVSFPLIFWFFEISNLQWWIFASVLIGEIIDRAEFYDELDVITPEKQIQQDIC